MASRSWIQIIPLTLLLATSCKDDDSNAGGTDGTTSDPGPTTSTSTTLTATTEASTSTTSTSDPSSSSTVGSTSTTAAADSSSSTGADPCNDCIAGNCNNEVATCIADRDCSCWLDCIGDVEEFEECVPVCGDRPTIFDDIFVCAAAECDDACGLVGGSTSTGSETTGGPESDVYEPCEDDGDCIGDLQCAEAIGYCSPVCMDDVQNCPEPSSGDPNLRCAPGVEDACLLDCSDGLLCPDGMTCAPFGGGAPICTY